MTALTHNIAVSQYPHWLHVRLEYESFPPGLRVEANARQFRDYPSYYAVMKLCHGTIDAYIHSNGKVPATQKNLERIGEAIMDTLQHHIWELNLYTTTDGKWVLV